MSEESHRRRDRPQDRLGRHVEQPSPRAWSILLSRALKLELEDDQFGSTGEHVIGNVDRRPLRHGEGAGRAQINKTLFTKYSSPWSATARPGSIPLHP